MTVIGGADGEVDQYCSEYFSVAKFMAAYADNVPALLGKDQWNIVDPGFKLHAPVITRPQEDQGTRGLEQVRRVVYQRSLLAKNVEFWGILLGFVPIQLVHHLEKRNNG